MPKIRAILFALAFLVSLATFASGGKLEPIDEVFEPAGNWDPKIYGKVAVVQWAPQYATPLGVSLEEAESFKQSNRQVLEAYVREAAGKGAKLIITPEFATVGYPDIPGIPPEQQNFQNREQVAPYVEVVNGPSTQFFQSLAKELGVYIHFGFVEVDPKTNLYYNAVVAVDADGKMVASYRKIHLFSGEDKYLASGNTPVTYKGPFGKIGIIICSDVYSSHPMNDYKTAKVDALALSTSWAAWNTGMLAFQSGAKWVGSYLLAANQNYFPDSGVVEASGNKQSHIRQTTGIAYGYLPYRP